MKKYRNTSFSFSGIDVLVLLLFAGMVMVSMFFYHSYSEVKEQFNIEKTKVDFIIQAPSSSQVTEISGLSHIDRIVPYYFRSISVATNKGSALASLYIIEKSEDISYTVFSNELCIKENKDLSGNQLLITEEVADSTGKRVGDTITLQIDAINVQFVVAGVFKSDHRHVGGSLLALNLDEVKTAVNSAKYSGAFVSSKNLDESKQFFQNEYIPQGDIRSREEFKSDEAYQTYLKTREQGDTTKETFSRADFLKELNKRNQSKLWRRIFLAIGTMLVAIIIVSICLIGKVRRYSDESVLRDIKDNYGFDQERDMFKRYFNSVIIGVVIVGMAAWVASYFLNWTGVFSPICCCGIAMAVILTSVISSIEVKSLKKRFFTVLEEYRAKLNREN